MTLIKPFRALRPAPGRAAEVLAPPYDVLSSAEARERAKGKPWSFLHVSKAEIDLDPATDPYDRAVYAKAAANFARMVEAGVLIREPRPCYYVYRMIWRGRVETGLAAVASLADYAGNRIRKHEHTTPAKEDDRVRQIEAVNAQTGPVMLAYPSAPAIDAVLAAAAAGKPEVDVTADDGVRHQLWIVADAAKIETLTGAVDALPALYVADGHHRSAAAARVAQSRHGDAYFLAVLFPQGEMTILDYNRVLRDLNGRSREALLAELRDRYTVEASADRYGLIRCRRGRHVPCRTLVPSFAAPPRPKRRSPPIRSSGCRSRYSHATSSSRFSASPIRAPTSASISSAAAAGSPSSSGAWRPATWRSRSRSTRRRCAI